MLGCEQLILMAVPSVVSADGSCCTWALPAAAADTGEGKDKDRQRSPRSDFPSERVSKSGSETEPDRNSWGHVPINRDGE